MRSSLSALLLLLPMSAFAMKAGISGYSNKTTGTNCSSCHTGGTVPSAAISGAPATLNVDATATVTVTITAGSMASTITGLDVALGGTGSTGATLIAGAGTQILSGELTQTGPVAFDGGIASFTFSVKAGETNGPMTLYVGTIAGNGDNADTGDSYYGFNRTIQITGTPPPPPDAGGPPPPTDGGTTPPPTDGGSGGTDGGPRLAIGTPGGFVDGDYGCSTGTGLTSGAWLLALGVLALAAQRRSTKRT